MEQDGGHQFLYRMARITIKEAGTAYRLKYLHLPEDTAHQYISTFNTISAKEIITDRWMGTSGETSTGVLKSLAAQAGFLREARQIAVAPADFRPFVDSSFALQVAEIEAAGI